MASNSSTAIGAAFAFMTWRMVSTPCGGAADFGVTAATMERLMAGCEAQAAPIVTRQAGAMRAQRMAAGRRPFGGRRGDVRMLRVSGKNIEKQCGG